MVQKRGNYNLKTKNVWKDNRIFCEKVQNKEKLSKRPAIEIIRNKTIFKKHSINSLHKIF